MSFVALPNRCSPSPIQPEPDAVITNDGFFPDVDSAEIRLIARISSSVTADVLKAAIIAAIVTVSNDLATWAAQQKAKGHAALDAIPATQIGGVSVLVQQYKRAVGLYAKAELIERYRDFDTTAAGGKDLTELEESIGDLRRDALHAVRDILGKPRTIVELI